MTDHPVDIECTAVPDGIVERGGERMLRLSLVLRPVAPSGGVPVDLLQWPRKISELRFAIQVRHPDGSISPKTVTPDHGDADAATALWQRIWEDASILRAYLHMLEPVAALHAGAPRVEKYSYAKLADIANFRIQTDVQNALHAFELRQDPDALSKYFPKDDERLEAPERLERLEKRAIADRRIRDPNDPIVRLHDARDLLRRDAFARFPIGDDIGSAVTAAAPPAATAGRGFGGVALDQASIDEIQTQFQRARDAVDASRAGAGAVAPGSWEPLAVLVDADQALQVTWQEQFTNPMRHAIYGKVADRSGNPPAPPAPPRGARAPLRFSGARQAFDTFDRAFGSDSPPRVCPASVVGPVPDPDPLALEAAHRRLAGLQAHPAVRKYLRLIVDVEVKAGDLGLGGGGRQYGTISATAEGPAAATRRIETAFVHEPAGAGPDLFEPCPEWEYPGGANANPSCAPSLPLRDGVVQLRIGTDGRQARPPIVAPGTAHQSVPERFRIESIDAVAATLAMRTQIAATIGAELNGAPIDQVPVDDPGARTRGLTLLDTEAQVTMHVAEKRAAVLRTASSSAPVTLYAEDLVEGYRLDLVDSRGRVHPAGARTLTYAPLARDGSKGTDLPSFPGFEDRDEGYITTGARERDDGGSLIVSESLLCWTGSNIGLPKARPADEPDYDRDGEHQPPSMPDLPIHIRYTFNTGKPGPILRVKKRYRFMLRARKINGSSVSTDFSARLADAHALGEPYSLQGYPFAPIERAPPPDILIPQGEPLAAPTGDSPEESTRDLIVRLDTIGRRQPLATRVLLSPPIGPEAAELAGMFDGEAGVDMHENGVYRRITLTAEGRYPTLRPSPTADGKRFLGHLCRLRANAPRQGKPSYADPTLRGLSGRLRASKATPASAIARALGRAPLWVGSPNNAGALVPVKLEVVARSGGKSQFEAAAVTELRTGGESMNVPTLRISVAPADTLELELWTVRDAETTFDYRLVTRAALQSLFRRPGGLPPVVGLGRQLSALSDPVGDKATREANWQEIAGDVRINALHTVTRLRIEHHVPAPLEPPSFDPSFGVARVADLVAWTAVADSPRPSDQKGAQRAYVYGAIGFHRRSTGAARCDCAWLDFDQAVAVQRTARAESPDELDTPGLWRHAPVLRRDTLFDLPNIPPINGDPNDSGYEAKSNRLDLVRDETGALRALSAPFADTRARRVVARLVARTRFPNSYPHATDAQLTIASGDEAGLAHALMNPGAALAPGLFDFWMKATQRPPKLALTNPMRAVYQRQFEPVEGLPAGQEGRRLVHLRRIWLGRDWNASGEDELLAVICRDRNSASPIPPWLDAQLSRWGADMTMRPGVPLVSEYLQPEEILGASVRRLIMPFPDSAGPDSPNRPDVRAISAALLMPRFDDGCGEWYCDIGTRGLGAFRIWMKLALARYQRRAIDGCDFSEAVTADPFLLHQPWTFSAARSGQQIEVTVTGPAYTERAPMIAGLQGADEAEDQVFDAAKSPVITAELEALDEEGESPLPVPGPDGKPITDDNGGQTPDIVDGLRRWRLTLPMLTDRLGKLAVRVSLASAHANSQAIRAASSDGTLIHLPEPISCQLKMQH